MSSTADLLLQQSAGKIKKATKGKKTVWIIIAVIAVIVGVLLLLSHFSKPKPQPPECGLGKECSTPNTVCCSGKCVPRANQCRTSLDCKGKEPYTFCDTSSTCGTGYCRVPDADRPYYNCIDGSCVRVAQRSADSFDSLGACQAACAGTTSIPGGNYRISQFLEGTTRRMYLGNKNGNNNIAILVTEDREQACIWNYDDKKHTLTSYPEAPPPQGSGNNQVALVFRFAEQDPDCSAGRIQAWPLCGCGWTKGQYGCGTDCPDPDWLTKQAGAGPNAGSFVLRQNSTIAVEFLPCQGAGRDILCFVGPVPPPASNPPLGLRYQFQEGGNNPIAPRYIWTFEPV